jgi:hypothetical protein
MTQRWTIDSPLAPPEMIGVTIDLLTPAELDGLPDGTVLVSIQGRRVAKGRDYIDDDTRGGYLAYGQEVVLEDGATIAAPDLYRQGASDDPR